MAEILNEELLDEVAGGKKKKNKSKQDWHCNQCNVMYGESKVEVYKVGSQYVCRNGHILNKDRTYTGRTDISLLN